MNQRVTTWLLALLVACGACGSDPSSPAADAPAGDTADAVGAPDAGPAPSVFDPAAEDPGITLRRLTRLEYDHTVRDLLGTTLRPGESFPPDASAHGWDHLAQHLSVSPLLVERWALAAAALAEDALAEHDAAPLVLRVEAEDADTDAAFPAPGLGVELWNGAPLEAAVVLPEAATWTVAARVWSHRISQWPLVALTADGVDLKTHAVGTGEDDPAEITAEVALSAGIHTIGVRLLTYPGGEEVDEVVGVDWLEARAPESIWPPAADTRARVLVCDPEVDGAEVCAATVAEHLARRAWRRPPSADEVATLTGVVAAGATFEDGVRTLLEVVLLSPHFLFRVERGPPDAEGTFWLDDHELASRLSYLLWSSMPDDALAALADDGTLQDEAVLVEQVERMLADPRAAALVEALTGQWLLVRALDLASPDPLTFPEFDGALRLAMAAETRAFFETFVHGDRSALELLTGAEAWVEDHLAAHYGLAEPDSALPVAVATDGTGRVGILGHGALLTVLSHPTRTSPVRRGKWVLEALLCETVEPPPPGVMSTLAADEAADEGGEAGSLVEQLLAHTTDPACAGCHAAMDPIGFALEHFDGVGAWRDSYPDGTAVDSAGQLPDGTPLTGADDLAQAVAADARLPACVVRRLFTYALGRLPRDDEADVLAQLTEGFVASGHRLPALLAAIVTSKPFRTRLPHPPPAPEETP